MTLPLVDDEIRSEISRSLPGEGVAGVTTPGNSAAGTVPGLEVKLGGLGPRTQLLALVTLCAVLFVTFLDNTVVSVGLANVQHCWWR